MADVGQVVIGLGSYDHQLVLLCIGSSSLLCHQHGLLGGSMVPEET